MAAPRGRDLFYEVAWERSMLMAQTPRAADATSWLMSRIEENRCSSAAQLEKPACERCSPGSRTQQRRRPRRFRTRSHDNPSIDGVVHLSLDSPALNPADPSNVLSAIETGCRDVLQLSRALVRRGSRARLHVVTRGARAVTSDAIDLRGLPQSPVWGLVRTLGIEHPELRPVAFDLDPDADADVSAAMLFREITSDSAEPEIGIRDGERYVPRLRRSRRSGRPEGPIR